MRGVVADQRAAPSGLAVGDDLDRSPSRERRREVAKLAVDLDRQRGLRQPGPDRRGRVGAGGAVGELELVAVGQRDLHGANAMERLSRPAFPLAGGAHRDQRAGARPADRTAARQSR